jgi:hypothetical protein
MNNYAEQNRQLLRRYTPEQCILLRLPNHIFKALQAGTPITWWDYGNDLFAFVLASVLVFFCFLVFLGVLAPIFNADAENPTGPDPTFIAFAIAAALVFCGVAVLATFESALTRVRELNAFWQHGKLLVSQQVEIVAPQDSDETYGLRYTFETPSGSITDQVDSSKTINDQVKAQPIMLMLYKSPQEYFIL